MKNVRNLKIYIKALDLVVDVYKLIQDNPQLTKDFSICDQMKRATISVPSNIAEGYARSRKQFKNYLDIAKGSANEMITLLIIVNLVYKIDTIELQNKYDYLAKQITSFSRSF